MGVDTNGVVLTNEKEFWKVSQRIGNAVHQIIRPNVIGGSLRERLRGNDEWKFPKMDVMETFRSLEFEPIEYFTISFTYAGEHRQMSVHTDCDHDLQNVHDFGEDAKGIILSVGSWGSSVEIMEKILEQLTDLGECYILEQDCNDDWRKV